jgi:chemotaxis protein methyltransferase CheR
VTKRPTVFAPDVARAAALFEEWIGFDTRESAPRRLKEFLVARAEMLGYETVEGYLSDLPADRPNSAEAQRLVNTITNGLTAFWRDRKQTEALGTLLEKLHERYRRPLSVWCAGCATGEEAYTVAIAAAELDVPVRVLGTDINTRFLDDARRAEFDDWSLRRLDDERRSRWFEQRSGRWALDPGVAGRVEFRRHNLLDWPPAAPEGDGWDVILCRNVVIYFTREATTSVLIRLAGAISADGYLLLGSSEHAIGEQAPFRATQSGPAFVYRPARMEPGQSLSFPPFEEPPPVAPPTLEEETLDFDDQDAVQQLLQAGVEHRRAEAAVACYEAAAGYSPFAPEIYVLLAETLDAESAEKRAIDALGKALFLDPHNWWAAAHRARLYEARDDRVEARRHWRMTLEGLAHQPGSPFDSTLAIGALVHAEADREKTREAAAAALERLASR